MTIGGEGTLNECQTRYTRIENGPTTAGTGKDNRNTGAREWNLPQRSAGVEMTTIWLISTKLKKKIQKPEKVSARSELQKNVCQQTCDIFKIHCTGLETGNILSYLSEDTLLKFLFL